jgi:nicotinate-nucleotide pyrophosphorylase
VNCFDGEGEEKIKATRDAITESISIEVEVAGAERWWDALSLSRDRTMLD